MPIINDWVRLALYGLVLAVPLGPVNLQIIRNAINRTLSATRPSLAAWSLAVLTGIGAMTGDFLVAFSAISLGNELIKAFVDNPAAKTILLAANVCILSFLGLSALRIKNSVITDALGNGKLMNVRNARRGIFARYSSQYGAGFLTVVTSPWSYLFWASFGSYIIIQFGSSSQSIEGRLAVVLMFLSGVALWVGCFSTTLAIIGKISSPRMLVWITKGSALFLLVITLPIAVEALCSGLLWLTGNSC